MRFLTLFLLVACAPHDFGTPCVIVPDAAGKPLAVTVTYSVGDGGPRDTSCAVDGTPNALTLSTSGHRRFDPTPFTHNLMLIIGSVTCDSAPLVAGPGTLTFGDQHLDFVVPGDGVTQLCLPGGFVQPQDTDAPVDTP